MYRKCFVIKWSVGLISSLNSHLLNSSLFFELLFFSKRFWSLDLNPIIDFVMSDSCIHCWCPDDVKRLTSKTGKNKTEITLLRYDATPERSELLAKNIYNCEKIRESMFTLLPSNTDLTLNFTKYFTKNPWKFAFVHSYVVM